jgi:hypothetical protein
LTRQVSSRGLRLLDRLLLDEAAIKAAALMSQEIEKTEDLYACAQDVMSDLISM